MRHLRGESSVRRRHRRVQPHLRGRLHRQEVRRRWLRRYLRLRRCLLRQLGVPAGRNLQVGLHAELHRQDLWRRRLRWQLRNVFGRLRHLRTFGHVRLHPQLYWQVRWQRRLRRYVFCHVPVRPGVQHWHFADRLHLRLRQTVQRQELRRRRLRRRLRLLQLARNLPSGRHLQVHLHAQLHRQGLRRRRLRRKLWNLWLWFDMRQLQDLPVPQRVPAELRWQDLR